MVMRNAVFLCAVMFLLTTVASVEEVKLNTESASAEGVVADGSAEGDEVVNLPPGHPPISQAEMKKAKGRCPMRTVVAPVTWTVELLQGKGRWVVAAAVVAIGVVYVKTRR